MSLREANRSREKNDPWIAIATRDRVVLSPRARERILPFYLLIFTRLYFLLRQTFEMRDDPRYKGHGENEEETKKRRESRLPARAFRQIEFAGAKASG